MSTYFSSISPICKISYQITVDQELKKEKLYLDALLNFSTNSPVENKTLDSFRNQIRSLKDCLKNPLSRLEIITLCFYRSLIVDKYQQELDKILPNTSLETDSIKFDVAKFFHFLGNFYPLSFKIVLKRFVTKDLENLAQALLSLPHLNPAIIADLKDRLQREQAYLFNTLLNIYFRCSNFEEKKLYLKEVLSLPADAHSELFLIKATLFAKYIVERISKIESERLIFLQSVIQEFPSEFISEFLKFDVHQLDFLKAQYALSTILDIKNKDLSLLRLNYLNYLPRLMNAETILTFNKGLEEFHREVQKICLENSSVLNAIATVHCQWIRLSKMDCLLQELLICQASQNDPTIFTPFPNENNADFFDFTKEHFEDFLIKTSQIFGEKFSYDPVLLLSLFKNENESSINHEEAYFIGYLLLAFYKKCCNYKYSTLFINPLLKLIPQSLLKAVLRIPQVNHFLFLLQNFVSGYFIQKNIEDVLFLNDFWEQSQEFKSACIEFKSACIDSLATNSFGDAFDYFMYHRIHWMRNILEYPDQPHLQATKEFLPQSIVHDQMHAFHLSQLTAYHPKSFRISFEYCLEHFDLVQVGVLLQSWSEQDLFAMVADLLKKTFLSQKATFFLKAIKKMIFSGVLCEDFLTKNIQKIPLELALKAFKLVQFVPLSFDTIYKTLKDCSKDLQNNFLELISDYLLEISKQITFLKNDFNDTLQANKIPPVVGNKIDLLQTLLTNHDENRPHILNLYLKMLNVENTLPDQLDIFIANLLKKVSKISMKSSLHHQILFRLELYFPSHYLQCVFTKDLYRQIEFSTFLKSVVMALDNDNFEMLSPSQILFLNEVFYQIILYTIINKIHFVDICQKHHLKVDFFPVDYAINEKYFRWIYKTHVKFLEAIKDHQDIKQLCAKLQHIYSHFPGYFNSVLANFIEELDPSIKLQLSLKRRK